MSYILRSLLNAYMHVTEETAGDAQEMVDASIPSLLTKIDVLGTASELGVVLCRNRVGDPAGRGDLSTWTATNGALRVEREMAPPSNWSFGVSCVATGGTKASLDVKAEPLAAVDVPLTLASGVTLPAATLTLTSTLGLPAAGSVYVAGQLVTYTGRTSSTLTGCSGGSGALLAGAPVSENLETCWWYALVNCSIPSKVSLRQAFQPNALYGEVTLPATGGWVLVGGPADLQPGGEYGVHLESVSSTPAADDRLTLTGCTLAQGGDPGGPFCGTTPWVQAAAFAWDGAPDGSASRLHTTELDAIALREAEAGLDVDPAGLTDDQRVLYLIKRRQARHQGGAKTLVDLIVALIQTEDPGFTSAQVRIVREYETRTFSVQIVNYNTSRVLAERVQRLVEQLHPLAMNFGGVNVAWPIAELESTFVGRTIADFEATYTTVSNAETNTA